MRNRSWLVLALLVGVTALATQPASAESGFSTGDQVDMITGIANQLTPPAQRERPSEWLDVGIGFPIDTFSKREWTNGFVVTWNQEFFRRENWSMFGAVGLNFNNDSMYNQAWTDLNFSGGLHQPTQHVDSRKHLAIPFSWELQIEPGANNHSAPFLSFGPGFTITRESLTHQESDTLGAAFRTGGTRLVPIIPAGEALVTTRVVNKTKFHPGYALHGGFRSRVGGGDAPLHMRLRIGWNVWYENASPVSMITGTLSFGR